MVTAINYRLNSRRGNRFLFDTQWATIETKQHRRPMVTDASGTVGSAAERSPRRLTTHQKAVLIQVLLAFPDETVTVRYLASASDALNYAEDFSTIFKAINWTVVPPEPAENLPDSSSGLAIVVRGEKLPASAEALCDALRIYGIEAQITRNESNLCGPSDLAGSLATNPASSFALAVTKH
jgi:hypothetical protein